jgi:hypothetical protein
VMRAALTKRSLAMAVSRRPAEGADHVIADSLEI